MTARQRPSWDDILTEMAQIIALRSKNPDRPPNGCFIVGPNHEICGAGWDSPPPNMDDEKILRLPPKQRMLWFTGAIRGAIQSSASPLRGCRVYLTSFPDHQDAHSICQAIGRDGELIISHHQWGFQHLPSTEVGEILKMFTESGIILREPNNPYGRNADVLKLLDKGYKLTTEHPHDHEITSLDDTYMELAHCLAKRSLNPKVQSGCIVIAQNGKGGIISAGFNSLPMGVNDNVPERLRDSGNKHHTEVGRHLWVAHAEGNAGDLARRFGVNLRGSEIVTTWPPCNECGIALTRGGVKSVVIPDQDDFCLDSEYVDRCEVALKTFIANDITFRRVNHHKNEAQDALDYISRLRRSP